MEGTWKTRLLAAIDADPRSDRKISKAAGNGVNFISELRLTDKEPSIEKVLKLADTLGVSLSYVFLGRDATPEEEAFLGLYSAAPPNKRRAVVELLSPDRTHEEG